MLWNVEARRSLLGDVQDKTVTAKRTARIENILWIFLAMGRLAGQHKRRTERLNQAKAAL
jgi:hypothetical protein